MPTPEAKRIAVSKYMKELRADPERRAAHNEKRRAYYHAKAKHRERAYYDRIKAEDPWGWRARNLRRNINPEITVEWLRALWESQGGKCPLSGRALHIKTAEMDHIIPRSRGGSHDLSSLRLLSPEANQAKGGMTDDEFIALCGDILGTQIPELIGRAILSSLGALSSHRPVKLDGCDGPTLAAPVQTIAALGAQARDDLTDQFTQRNSLLHEGGF